MQRRESLQDVANSVGVSKAYIWELEKGRSQNPSMEMLTKLANHFQVTIRRLVGEDPEAKGADEDSLRMFRQFSELTSAERAVLDDMIQSMLKRKKAKDDSD